MNISLQYSTGKEPQKMFWTKLENEPGKNEYREGVPNKNVTSIFFKF